MAILKWCRRRLLPAHLLLLAGIALIATLLWYSGEWFLAGSRETFGALNSYIFIWVSIAIASIAALNSMLSSSIASDAQRPFLYASGPIEPKRLNNHVILKFTIHNSGSLPAGNVQADIQFFDTDEEVTEENLGSKYVPPPVEPISPIVFPNSEVYRNYVLTLTEASDAELLKNMEEEKTKCRVRITYTSLGRKHITIQTIQLSEIEWEKKIAAHPIPPQKWK